MSYIGKTPTVGSFLYADDITTSSTNTYNILVGGVAFSPQESSHVICSLNGVIQKGGGNNPSFTISGSQITFLPSSGTLSSSDSIDFLLILGSVNDVGVATTVTDSAITKGKLNLISDSSSAGLTVKGDGSSENGTIALNCSSNSHAVKLSSPSHASGQSYEMILPTTNITAGKFLKVDSVSGSGATGIGQLSFADAGGGITGADQWRIDASVQYGTGTQVIDSNWERVDAPTGYGVIGTAMSESSGIFTFPSTGFWLIQHQQVVLRSNGEIQRHDCKIQTTHNNSTYANASEVMLSTTSSNYRQTGTLFYIFDVSNTTTHKVRFQYDDSSSNNPTLVGDTTHMLTGSIFIRLADT